MEQRWRGDLAILNEQGETNENLQALNDWWETAKSSADDDGGPVEQATLHGSRMALKLTAIVPRSHGRLLSVADRLFPFHWWLQGTDRPPRGRRSSPGDTKFITIVA